jgi:hypothetical protein
MPRSRRAPATSDPKDKAFGVDVTGTTPCSGTSTLHPHAPANSKDPATRSFASERHLDGFTEPNEDVKVPLTCGSAVWRADVHMAGRDVRTRGDGATGRSDAAAQPVRPRAAYTEPIGTAFLRRSAVGERDGERAGKGGATAAYEPHRRDRPRVAVDRRRIGLRGEPQPGRLEASDRAFTLGAACISCTSTASFR